MTRVRFALSTGYLYGPEPVIAKQSRPIGPGDTVGTSTPVDPGLEVKSHRSPYMCFPALPIALPQLGNFTEITGIDADLIQNTSITDYCGTMTIDSGLNSTLASVSMAMGPISATAFRRLFQNPVGATASVSNIIYAFGAQDMTSRTIHAACALSRLNALLWTVSFIVVFIALYLVCCWPCTNIIAVLIRFTTCFACFGCCPGIWERRRRMKKRAKDVKSIDARRRNAGRYRIPPHNMRANGMRV